MLTANPDINLLWGANEGGTIGATMAVKNAGLAGKGCNLWYGCKRTDCCYAAG